MSTEALARALHGAYAGCSISLPEDPEHRWCDEDGGGSHRFDSDAWLDAIATDLAAALDADGLVIVPRSLVEAAEAAVDGYFGGHTGHHAVTMMLALRAALEAKP